MARGYLFVIDLTRATLAWARVMAGISRREIIYLRRSGSLGSEEAGRKLADAGIRAFSFEDCQTPDNGYYYGDKPGVATAVADQLAATGCFRRCLTLYDHLADHEAKLRIVFRSYVDQECFDLGHVLAWLSGQKDPGPAWVLAPMGFIRRRYLARAGARLRPCPGSSLLRLARALRALVAPLRRLVRGAAPRAGNADAAAPTLPGHVTDPASFPARVLFFPHQTLSYGGLFFKDQFYSGDPASAFHPSRILHLELAAPRARHISPGLVDFHRRHDIHWTVLPGSSAKQRAGIAIASLFQVVRRGGLSSVIAGGAALTALSIAVRARRQYHSYRAALGGLGKAEIALVGYEILTPKLLYLALDSLGIRTVASQERFHAPILYDNWNFILDTYFTGSEAISGLVRQSRFKHAANPVAVGQVRTDLLVKCRARYSRETVLPESRGHDRVVVVYDAPAFTDPDVARMMYVANLRSNLAFYRDILELARRFPRTLFVIRSKDLGWTRLADYGEALRAIGSQPNLDISREYDIPNFQYRLAAVADLVIAKYTSIGDECMGLGIPVIYHDYTPVLPAAAHRTFDYGGLPVFVHDYQALETKTGEVLETGHYLEPSRVDELATLVNGGRADGGVHHRIHRHLEAMLPARETDR